MPAETEPTELFSSRADYYRRARPSYPPALGDFLAQVGFLTDDSMVADIGSGTGLLSQLFLERGNIVYGVEPNPEMRRAAEEQLAGTGRFHSVAATAEATTLPDGFVDLVVAGQALHWFDLARAPAEFCRILGPTRRMAVVYNRAAPGSLWEEIWTRLQPFDIVREHPAAGSPAASRERWFFLAEYREEHFTNVQHLDYQGIVDRVLSISGKPLPGQPGHEPMMAELDAIFAGHEAGGLITLEYQTDLVYGLLDVLC